MDDGSRKASPQKRDIHGWINFDKPVGMTSTFAVSVIKRAFRARKAGHAGTLDPLASGILPIALGEATKTVPYIVDGQKSYRFTISWGKETNTDDLEGKIVEQSDARPSQEQVEALLPQFTGTISQIPPRYSAVKINGERAYDLARSGEEVELQPRLVDIDAIRIVSHDQQTSVLEVECGKGTYIRAIARDMGRILGCFGHVSTLRRTRVGPFTEQKAVQVETVEENLEKVLFPVQSALDGITAIMVPPDQGSRLSRGQSIILRGRDAPDSGTVYALSKGVLVAIGDVINGELHPNRVFNIG